MAFSARLRQSWAVFLFVFFLQTFFLRPCMSSAPTPEFVKAFNNTADGNSSITWGPLPAGEPYLTDTNYDEGGLGPYHQCVRNFLDVVQPNDVPYDIIEPYVNSDDDTDSEQKDILDVAKELVSYIMGFLVCMGIGLLFVLIMPFVGCCFGCCRCCGNCGGSRKYKNIPNATCKCRGCTIALAIMTAFVLTGGALTLTMNERMTKAVTGLTETSATNLDDFDKFVSNLVHDMDHLTKDNFNFTTKVLMRDLNNIDVILGTSIQTALGKADIDDVTETLYNFDKDINELGDSMIEVNKSTHTLIQSSKQLEDDLAAVASDIDTACAALPGGIPTCTAQGIDTSTMVVEADFSALPDISDELEQMEDVRSKDITQQIEEGKKKYDDIPGTIKNDTQDIVDDLSGEMDTFSSTIQDELSAVDDLTSDVEQRVEDYKQEIKDIEETIEPYNEYRWYGGLGLGCIIIVIGSLQFFGLLLGVIGYTSDASNRGCLSNSGGNMLMASVVFIFLFSWLMMLLTSFSFLIGGNMEKILCEPLQDLNSPFYDTFIDKDNNYLLGRVIHNDETLNLTISEVLSRCGDNAAAFDVLMLDKKVDLDKVTDYKQEIDIESHIDDINTDLSNVELLSQDTINQLRNFSDAVQLDYTGFKDELEKDTTDANLMDYASKLDTLANLPANSPGTDLRAAAIKLRAINSGSYAIVNTAQADLLADIEDMEARSDKIPAQVDEVINKTQELEKTLKTDADAAVKSESKKYGDRLLGTTDSFVNYTLDQVRNNIGGCKPVANLWESMIDNTLCGSIIDSFNGFWFALGWSLFFMIPSLILNVKLAKHFRRMAPGRNQVAVDEKYLQA